MNEKVNIINDDSSVEPVDKKKNKKKESSFRVSQRLVLSLVVGITVAVVSYISLWGICKLSENRSYSSFESKVADCTDYVVHSVSSHRGESDYDEAMGEIRTMAYSLPGRILVVDNTYKVKIDSYGLDIGKYIVDSGVNSVMSGVAPEDTMFTDNMYRKVVPSKDGNENIDQVIIVSVKLDDIQLSNSYLRRNVNYLFALSVILGIICAFVAGGLSVRDVNRMRNKIEAMKGGNMELVAAEGMFLETSSLAGDINDIFNRISLLEESRQEFVSNVSHELKTPITSMKVLSESLLTQSDVPAEMYREFMEDIVQEIDREAEIISDLLTLVKTDKGPDSLNLENIDMNEFMELILKRLKPLAEKRSIELSYESFKEIHADIDKVKFTLAISNLIENGIKYNVDGGWVKVTLNSDNKNFYIKVADSGVGIPEDCINNIFERFYRVDKARSRDTGGTGLGLAITKNIILLHMGTINVYSEPGKGTTFTVKVPLKV